MPHSSRVSLALPYGLAALLTVTGSLHFLAPKPFASIIPDGLPHPTVLVYASGVAELLCAAGLVVPRSRRVAGWTTAALFVAVFPANVQMALDSGGRSGLYQAGAWARLALQVPLVLWAATVARQAARVQRRTR